jgi:DNA-binding FadR family transcriptional regulator
MPQLRKFQVTKKGLHRRRRTEEPQGALVAMLLKSPEGMSAMFRARIRYEKTCRRYVAYARTESGIRALRRAYKARSR